jgi:hypothetical protein
MKSPQLPRQICVLRGNLIITSLRMTGRRFSNNKNIFKTNFYYKKKKKYKKFIVYYHFYYVEKILQTSLATSSSFSSSSSFSG